MMNQDLKAFAMQWLRVAAMTLVPVVFVAFVSIPYTLGGHPGDAVVRVAPADGHMT